VNDASPWYRDGLAFACTRCGHCCTGAPGFVWVDGDEIARLAGPMDLTPEAFAAKFVRRVGHRLSLIEHRNGDCVFWDRASGCTVYEGRPDQCRTWPFWERNVHSPEAWVEVGRGCPGVGRGQLVAADEITALLPRGPRL
jgi:Fe-S-cluster containining protein